MINDGHVANQGEVVIHRRSDQQPGVINDGWFINGNNPPGKVIIDGGVLRNVGHLDNSGTMEVHQADGTLDEARISNEVGATITTGLYRMGTVMVGLDAGLYNGGGILGVIEMMGTYHEVDGGHHFDNWKDCFLTIDYSLVGNEQAGLVLDWAAHLTGLNLNYPYDMYYDTAICDAYFLDDAVVSGYGPSDPEGAEANAHYKLWYWRHIY